MPIASIGFWVYRVRVEDGFSESEKRVHPGLPISEEDWSHTPASVQAVVITLWQQLQALQAEAGQLGEQIGRNSQNSSRPPSSDLPNAPPRPKRTASGRKAGGQPGHAGHGRSLKPIDQVQRVVELKPIQCAACGALLLGEDPDPVRHQVAELPRVQPEVTEYWQQTLTCLACGAPTQAGCPAEMPPGSFGPRLQAMVGYLAGRIGASQREIEEVLETVFHTDLGLGSVPAQEDQVSVALAEPVQAVQAYVQQQLVQNVDETSWREQTKRAWLWINTTPLVTLFRVMATWGAAGAQQVLGAAAHGIVGSDRWTGYNWLKPHQRQLCWAHLKRDFQALVDRGGESARIGRALLEQVERTFRLWHGVRDGTLNRMDFQTDMQPIQRRVGELLREGATLSCDPTRHTCENLLKLEVALRTYVGVEGVEPTNNAAERQLRRGVLWRRRSFGTQSEEGSRFVERVLTAIATLRQQRRDVLDYLTEACAAAIRGDKGPSLLPDTSPVNTVT